MENIKGTDVTVSSQQVFVQNVAGITGVTGVQVTNSALGTYQLVTTAGSISNGNVKAGAGYFFGLNVTTAGGIEVKDGTTVIYAKSSMAAGDQVHWGGLGLNMATNITVSSSLAVVAVLYR